MIRREGRELSSPDTNSSVLSRQPQKAGCDVSGQPHVTVRTLARNEGEQVL